MRRQGAMVRAALAANLAFTPAALALDDAIPIRHAIHESWGRREGLPSAGVRAIAQDADGYLWIGTDAGLARFDGARFVVIDTLTDPVLRSSVIVDLMALEDGSLLAATLDGLYRVRGMHVTAIAGTEGTDRFQGLVRGADGRILALLPTGVATVEGGLVTRLPLVDTSGDARIAVSTAAVDAQEVLWIVSDNGRRLLRVAGERAIEDPLTAAGPAVVTALAADTAGRLWVVAEPGGLMRRDGVRFVAVPLPGKLPAASASRMLAGPGEVLWIGYRDGSLARVRAGAVETIDGAAPEMGGAGLQDLVLDREGSLWFAARGLHRLRDAPVVTRGADEGWPGGAIQSVFTDSRGRLWIGPQSGGILRLEEGVVRPVPTPGVEPGFLAMSFAEDSLGAIWFGTNRRGIWRIDTGGQPRLVAPERRRDLAFYLSPCPGESCMVAGLSSGAWRLTPGEAREMPFVAAGQIDYAVLATLVDRQGRVWVGTAQQGVFVRDGDRWERVAPQDDRPMMVLGLHEDAEGSIWVATVDHGLLLIRGGTAFAFGRRQGLPGDTVYQVVDGPGDRLWLATPDGIARVGRADLIAVADGRLPAAEARLYGAEDGLRAGECNGGGRVIARAAEGALHFATPDGVATVDPARLTGAAIPPPVLIEAMTCDGASLDVGAGRRRIPAATRRCDVRYTALGLRAPARLRFRTRLEGLDKDWVEGGAERVAHFTHLGPGDYTFRVIAADEEGLWNSTGANLSFSVAPRPWQTARFWVLAAALGTVLLATAHRLRIGALLRREADLERVVARRTYELAESNRTLERRVEDGIARLRDSERMAAYGEMVAGVAHEVRHPIFTIRSAAHLIGRKAAGLREEIALPLGTLERETGRMARLMDDLLAFARPQALVRSPTALRPLLDEAAAIVRSGDGWDEIGVDIETAPGLPDVSLDRERIMQVLVNLMENARKHATGVTRVRLAASRDGGAAARTAEGAAGTADGAAIRLVVSNDGAGMDRETLARVFEPFFTRGAGTGLGLAIARRIVAEHGGAIAAESTPETGSRFTITLPLQPSGGP